MDTRWRIELLYRTQFESQLVNRNTSYFLSSRVPLSLSWPQSWRQRALTFATSLHHHAQWMSSNCLVTHSRTKYFAPYSEQQLSRGKRVYASLTTIKSRTLRQHRLFGRDRLSYGSHSLASVRDCHKSHCAISCRVVDSPDQPAQLLLLSTLTLMPS